MRHTTGSTLNPTSINLSPSFPSRPLPAGIYLSAALPRLAHTPLSFQLLAPHGPAASLEEVLASLAAAARASRTWQVRRAAERLLAQHAGGLVQLLTACLQWDPRQFPAGSDANSRVQAAAEQLVQLCGAAVACLASAGLSGAQARYIKTDAGAVQQLESALVGVLNGTASWHSWLPPNEHKNLHRLSAGAKAQLRPLFAAVLAPPPAGPGLGQESHGQHTGTGAAMGGASTSASSAPYLSATADVSSAAGAHSCSLPRWQDVCQSAAGPAVTHETKRSYVAVALAGAHNQASQPGRPASDRSERHGGQSTLRKVVSAVKVWLHF